MKAALPLSFVRAIAPKLCAIAAHRPPDFVIGDHYLERWYLTPWSRYERGSAPTSLLDRIRRRLPSIYLHHFLHSDDDRALHDHPWINLSILLRGFYIEHTIAAGGVNHHELFLEGAIKFRFARQAHRIEVTAPCWTLFLTGPVIRDWGFHCPAAWRPWRQFVSGADRGRIGRGCG